eukprot:TRINITY_DN3158_c0_g2_i1.p1 TRINITY_DN3158_c0_g2~~TRINITY_DN3158_c0_g2_i1.p1  ORF type:complete len:182 (-),score=26.81 TRINITY_DN3158_c0_g2_i1:6-479(-)
MSGTIPAPRPGEVLAANPLPQAAPLPNRLGGETNPAVHSPLDLQTNPPSRARSSRAPLSNAKARSTPSGISAFQYGGTQDMDGDGVLGSQLLRAGRARIRQTGKDSASVAERKSGPGEKARRRGVADVIDLDSDGDGEVSDSESESYTMDSEESNDD